MSSTKRRACVVGAGTAGLCALKNLLENGMEATVYEQTTVIGGTWVYTEETEAPYGDGPHSSMYTGLRTNLPKEVMGYPDYTYPDDIKESFVTAAEVLKFLRSYAKHFNLEPYIKFNHEIIRIRPRNDEWEVHVRDIQSDEYKVVCFDYVFVCNGHYTWPQLPEIDGMDIYRGHQIHSHHYKKPDPYKDASVLIIGCGPSGMDIGIQLDRTAKKIYLSHHFNPAPHIDFLSNVVRKVDVERFTENGAIFKDGSHEEFSHVIYCTGYKYSFRCLSIDCGIGINDHFVHPLYKHCINITNPTMALIGLPFKVCPTHLCDLQVRFALTFYTGRKQLPSKKEMLADLERDLKQREACGLSKRQAHEMGERQFDYYTELAETAGIERMKPVIVKIMQACGRKYIYELETYRNKCYKIIDDENFIKYDLADN